MLIIAKFMYMGYHIPLSFAVTLRSKKLKSFLEKKNVLNNSGNKVGKRHGPPQVYNPGIRV